MNNVIKEIQRLTNLERNKILLALEKLYNHLDYSIINIQDDWHNKYLTLTDNNILWYLDCQREGAINIVTGEILSDEEIDRLINHWIVK